VARAEAYLHAKFHLDPSNRLATIHLTNVTDYRTDRQTDRIDRPLVVCENVKNMTRMVTIN